jgi:hypothetical protein
MVKMDRTRFLEIDGFDCFCAAQQVELSRWEGTVAFELSAAKAGTFVTNELHRTQGTFDTGRSGA